jgi:alkylation response protein AidB-like acyl-CoA dehydrogenase
LRVDSLSPPDPLARARDLGPALAAAAAGIEREQRIPEPLEQELYRSRLLRMLLPRSAGGDQIEPTTYFKAVEEIARHDASVAWIIFVANSAALIAAFLELEVARTIFADTRTVVAWGPPNATRALGVEGGYRLSGTWDFASGCRHANWMGAHCHVREADGSLRLNRHGQPTIRTLLFPAERASILDTWNVIGLRGTGSDSYRVTELFVPEAFSTTREDPALRRERGPLYAFTMQGLYATGVAAVACGTARAMLDHFVDLAARKSPRGLARLAANAVIQGEVARAEAKLVAARAYLLETLGAIYQGADEIEPIGLAERARVRLACVNAIHGAVDVAYFAYRAAGVDAIFTGSAFERRFRDIHTLSQQIQARGAHFEAVGQVLLGQPPETFF